MYGALESVAVLWRLRSYHDIIIIKRSKVNLTGQEHWWARIGREIVANAQKMTIFYIVRYSRE